MGLYETTARLDDAAEPTVAPEGWWDMKRQIDRPLHGLASMAISLAAQNVFSGHGDERLARVHDLFVNDIFSEPFGDKPGLFKSDGLNFNTVAAMHSLSFLRAVSYVAHLTGQEPGQQQEFGDLRGVVRIKHLDIESSDPEEEQDPLPESCVVRYMNSNEGIGGYLELTTAYQGMPDQVSQLRLLANGLSVAHLSVDPSRNIFPVASTAGGFPGLSRHLEALSHATCE